MDPVIKSHLLYQLSYKGGLGAFRKDSHATLRMLASLAGVASASRFPRTPFSAKVLTLQSGFRKIISPKGRQEPRTPLEYSG